MEEVKELEERYPSIPWREPVKVNEVYFGCRVCIALIGLKGRDISTLPVTREGFERHWEAEHA